MISKEPLQARRDEKIRQQTPSAPHLLQSRRKAQGTLLALSRGESSPSPKPAALATNFPAAAWAPSLTGSRSHDSPVLASQLAPLIPAPYSPLLQEFGQKRKSSQSPHSVLRDRGATWAPHKEAAGSEDPAALPGASAGDGQAGTSTEQRSSGRTSTRAHEQCSTPLCQSARTSLAPKKKKKKSELQAPQRLRP